MKFHSIFYRYPLFIFLFALFSVSLIADSDEETINIFNTNLIVGTKQINHFAIGISAIVIVIFSFVNYKLYISKEGIYLKKPNLFVQWDEILAVSHVWINDYTRKASYFYNRKTMVIYRKNCKPICIYNISLLALYVVKFYNPKIKTNIVSATLTTALNLALNAWILYEIYSKQIENIEFQWFMIWIILYAVKTLLVPLVMVKYQNKLHGDFLSHATIRKRNASEAIHI